MPEDTRDIFISYRRDESAGHAGRIADRLIERFGEDRVFHDIDSIEPGSDFPEAIERAVGSSEVLIAVIGRNWATKLVEHERTGQEDYVRPEIAAALQRDIRVIPVLVQGATMPSTDELPDDLAPLARRNAFELHDSSWREELGRLLTTLDRVLECRPVGKRDSSSQSEEGARTRLGMARVSGRGGDHGIFRVKRDRTAERRIISLFVDGEEIGDLVPGQDTELDVEIGLHDIQVQTPLPGQVSWLDAIPNPTLKLMDVIWSRVSEPLEAHINVDVARGEVVDVLCGFTGSGNALYVEAMAVS